MPPFNTTGLIIASLIPLIVGFFWYMPAVFGTIMAKQNNVDPNEKKGHHPLIYVGTLICSVLIAMLLSAILSTHDTEEVVLMHGLFHGLGAALFLGIPTFVVIALFESRSAIYILIHAGYWLVSMSMMGAVLGYFGI